MSFPSGPWEMLQQAAARPEQDIQYMLSRGLPEIREAIKPVSFELPPEVKESAAHALLRRGGTLGRFGLKNIIGFDPAEPIASVAALGYTLPSMVEATPAGPVINHGVNNYLHWFSSQPWGRALIGAGMPLYNGAQGLENRAATVLTDPYEHYLKTKEKYIPDTGKYTETVTNPEFQAAIGLGDKLGKEATKAEGAAASKIPSWLESHLLHLLASKRGV